jgi:multiple antibiotic resistance protein
MSFLQAFDLKEITSITLILFAIIDVVGTVPVIIELKRKAGGHIDAEKASLG